VESQRREVQISAAPQDSAPKRETLRFDAAGDQITVTLDGLNRQGLYHSQSTGRFDGVDVPVQAAPAPQQATVTYAFTRIDDHTWEIVIKINGQPRILVHNVVSQDGKTMTGFWRAATSQGQQMSDVVSYEKQ
jgi:hypothetical protein